MKIQVGTITALVLVACAGEPRATPPVTAVEAPAANSNPSSIVTTSTTAVTPPAPPERTSTLAEREQKTLTDQWAAFNAHDLPRVLGTYAADAVFVAPGPAGMKEGTRADTEKFLAGILTAFPDVKSLPTRAFQKGNAVVWEWVGTGTNTGEFNGDKPTGKPIGFLAVTVDWFGEDGKIKRELNVLDDATIAQQLGKMPGKARPVVAAPTRDVQWFTSTDPVAEAKLVETAKASWWPATWTKKDRKGYEATLGDASGHYEIASPNDFVGKPALLAEYDLYAKALPDSVVTIEDAWAVGNVVILQFAFGGTMKGAIGPFKATHEPLVIHGIDIDELADSGTMGKMATYSNGMELLAGVGALPKSPPPGAPKKSAN